MKKEGREKEEQTKIGKETINRKTKRKKLTFFNNSFSSIDPVRIII